MDAKKCQINVRLLPIKAHYFFFLGAIGGVMPFMQVLAKGLGISATAVGLVFTVVPFCVFFSKPVFGYITDYFQNIKLIVFILVSVTSISYLSVIFIPSIDNRHWTGVQLQCERQEAYLSLLPYEGDENCLKDALKHDENCDLKYRLCDSDSPVNLHGKVSFEFLKDIQSENSSSLDSQLYISNSTFRLKFQPDANFTCDCAVNNSTFLKCAGPLINSCFSSEKAGTSSVYYTYQFWLFALLALISGTGAATVFCLSDAACYEVLGDEPQRYGRQRLWGTISWGTVTLLAGFFNDIATAESGASTYSPGFYIMLCLVVIDLLLLMKIQLTKANFSLSICKDIGKIFSSSQTVAFAVAVYIIGALTGLIWNYQFWYLQDLGASQTLLGLTVAVQCLVAEVPFFFFAGWFIKTFGYFYCLTASFTAFALRLGLYYLLRNPWMILPIEVLHGLTFAVFYASMTGYASDYAPPGTEATMMGIFGGLYEGLGVATGSLLGGVGFDKLGDRNTFLAAAIISLICIPAFTIVHVVIRTLAPIQRARDK